jgi:3-hydroxyisobutyrate dehydrogenase-like beta-hydroxyacid dehydrogenase
MAKLAFCGLGQMGAAMAARLIATGHELAVWNRTAGRTEPLAAAGARVAGSPAEAARGAEAVFTMLTDAAALDAVVFGDGSVAQRSALAAGLEPGAALVDCSTIGPGAIRTVAERLGEAVPVLDAPVLGSVPQARQGTLRVFAGGPVPLLAELRPVLDSLGTVVHFGPLGSGQAMKLVANSTLPSLMTTLGEAVALAGGLGLDLHQVFDVLVGSAIGVTATGKRPLVESGRYPPNFKLSLAVKDAELILGTAAAGGLQLRVAEAARDWYREALAAGLGALDYSAVIAHIAGLPAALGS